MVPMVRLVPMEKHPIPMVLFLCGLAGYRAIEYRSDDVLKMKFVKLWDLLRYPERTTSKTPTR